ncbi:MAG: gliding motility-associated C-terminal domain-containing protein [Flavobacteriales bacterium]|nr:MAG: gliding motility-associated C-terminal domain-containing protein [Flavobacteriales bacterium]
MLLFKKIILFVLFLGLNYASAQIITVTSNADSGPGTLREALQTTSANGPTNNDVIQFNLGSSIADRTIRLRSQLPVVGSNVVIDGSTQPGGALGVSGAKVIIEPENSPAGFSALVVGSYSITGLQTVNVEIYGLYIRRFAQITNLTTVNLSQGSGIVLDYRMQNVIIGKPGKGNVLCGNVSGILMRNNSYYSNSTAASGISIQSNLIGVMDDGTTPLTNFYGISGDLSEYNLSIGGDNAGEGNVIAANGTNVLINKSYLYSNFITGINIINNKIGTDHTGQKVYDDLPIFLSSSTVEMHGIKINATLTDANIHRNVIAGQRSWGVTIANADFTITGNYIGTNVTGTADLGNNGGIRLEGAAVGIVGGAATADVNYIGYNRFGVESASSRPMKITQNSFFCNDVFGIGKTTTAPQAYIQILKKRADYISGKSTPNAEIELFYTDNCANSCQGKTFITSVRAGNDGRWEYNGSVATQVTATATIPSATTSPFADAGLLENEAIVDPITCNGNGSITIAEPREGITFKWYKIEDDGTAGEIASTQSVNNLAVGTYEVHIFDGCKTTTHKFFITDQVLTKPVIVAPTPACSQTAFPFSATVLRGKGNIIYEWLNAANVIVARGANVSLPEGTYRVRVKDEATCEQTSDPVTIVARPSPIINLNAMRVKAAACGRIDGGITGIVVTPAVGTATYRWLKVTFNEPEVEVGTSLDLENVDGGNYVLEVTDRSTCSPLRSGSIFVNITNSVLINGGSITNTTCGKDNGAVRNVTITDANTYEWYSPTGTLLKSGSYSTGMLLEFTDLAPGTYRLTGRSTITGCTNNRDFIVTQTPTTTYDYTPVVIDATCNILNGSISLNFTSATPRTFLWKDAQGNIITTGTVGGIRDLAPGVYTYHAFDIYNCETILGPYTIANTPLLAIVPNTGVVSNDGCGLLRGSVKDVVIIGGVPEYSYKWINQNNEAVKYTKDLEGVGAGEYRLIVTDKTTCGTFTSQIFKIEDFSFEVSTPVVSDIRVCYATDISINIKNPEEGVYQLFKNEFDISPMLESDKGTFNFKVAKSGRYYMKRKLGNCESVFSNFFIEVTNDNLEITNTMTPNGDGLNDTWVIRGLPNYKDITIQLYSRSGQLVYESRGGYEKPFDGIFRGQSLPAGAYYYHIDLKADCKLIKGSLTLLR